MGSRAILSRCLRTLLGRGSGDNRRQTRWALLAREFGRTQPPGRR